MSNTVENSFVVLRHVHALIRELKKHNGILINLDLHIRGHPVSGLLSSHFFFKDNDFRPVAFMRADDPRAYYLFDKEAAQKIEERDARWKLERQNEIGEEKKLEMEIITNLKKQGENAIAQKRTPYGIIDIFVGESENLPPLIIEVKADFSRSSIQKAVGQLIFDSFEYPNADLFIAVPNIDLINPAIKTGLGFWGIKIWEPK